MIKGFTLFRAKLFDMIERDDGDNLASRIYDYAMVVFIVLSLVPLAFKEDFTAFFVINSLCAVVFIIDYALRWFTADFKLGKGRRSFLLYPFSFMAIVDLLSILPYFSSANSGLAILRILRMAKAMRAFRILRYSKSISIISQVIKRQRTPLLTVCSLAVAYIIVAALAVFNVEPDTFENFFDAIYWATISLTTLGYGDIYPVSAAGRIITMLSTLVGMAIIALPSGIITAGYIHELNENHDPEGALDELESYVKL